MSKTRASFTDDQISMLVRNTEQFGCGPGDDRRPQQLRRGRLEQHRAGKGDAGRFPDQERQGEGGRGAGDDDARQRNRPGKLLAKGHRHRGPEGPRPEGLLRRAHWDNFSSRDDWLWRDRSGTAWCRSAPAEIDDGQARPDAARRHARFRARDADGAQGTFSRTRLRSST